MISIGVPAESLDERRIGLSPETAKKLVKLGAKVRVRSGAGLRSHFSDEEYRAAGAEIVATDTDAVKDADIVLTVRRPTLALVKSMKQGAMLIAILDPYSDAEGLQALAKSGASLFAMELMPRISRAQSMDVLSSQANLAGYKAVVDAAAAFERALPMMMTAAGTVPAARVFVMGVGVAGLQAIATARRLGAIVTATDVRPAVKEQVASLGAKFIAVEDDEFRQAETGAGYAKEMSDEYKKKQAALVADHVKNQDIVITTALIPGRPAPKLISKVHDREHAPRLHHRGSRGGTRRQCRARHGGRGGRAQRRAHHGQSQSAGRGAGECIQPLRPQSPRLHRADGRQEDRRARGQLGRRARQGHAGREGWCHRECDDCRASRCGAGIRVEVRQRRRDREAPGAEGRQDMRQAQALLACAIFGSALLVDCLAGGSAYAQHAAESGSQDFVFRFSIFVLAIFAGYYVVWSVTPAPHTPLMSVTNAISSVIVVGALLAVTVEASEAAASGGWIAKLLGFAALIMASVNIFSIGGGMGVTMAVGR